MLYKEEKKMNKERSSASRCVSDVVVQECRVMREEVCCCSYQSALHHDIVRSSSYRPSHPQKPEPPSTHSPTHLLVTIYSAIRG